MSPNLKTTVSSVIVYPDRARVTRRGVISLEAGAHLLEVDHLPLQLNPDSLRAAAQSTARARLLGVQVQRRYYAETPEERIRELEDEVESLEDEILALEKRADSIHQNRAAIDSLIGRTEIYATALASGEVSVEQQLALFDGLRSGAAKLDDELREISAQKRVLERRLDKLKNELGQLHKAPRRERYNAEIQIEIEADGELDLELSYVVSGARWKPLYDLRLQVDAQQQPSLALDYLAQVTQRSGEDWEDVELVLSTARPALTSRPPELDPWYLHRVEPRHPEMVREEAGPRLMKAMAMPEPDYAVEAPSASVRSEGAAVSYEVTGRVSVPPDGSPRKVTVAKLQLPPEIDYVSAPRLLEAVYRRAKVTNGSQYVLLPGQADLFASGEYIGSMALELIAPQQEIELYLGVEDRIVVERELVRRDVDKRLIGGKRRIQYGYETSLKNLLPFPAKLVVNDQIPVSQHEDVKVRLDSAEPKPAERSELNLLTWNLDLGAGEKEILRLDFTVEYPQDMELIGLV